jgi:hypothetical protein
MQERHIGMRAVATLHNTIRKCVLSCSFIQIFFVSLCLLPVNLIGQTVEIDSNWLASRQPPYTLTGSGNTYVLSTDVTTEGTAFLFSDSNIVFDLGGHTITYANLDFTGIYNPGFELASVGNPAAPAGWDLSRAPHARRQDYTEKLFYDDFSLRMENPAGDAFSEEYCVSPQVYIPAAGRYAAIAQVKGNPSKAVRVSLAVDGASVAAENSVSKMPMVYQGTDMSIGIILEFTVDSPCYVRVRVILGTTDPSESTGADIDEVDVRPIGLYGIALSGYNHSLSEIRNGSIREGRSQAIYSHALYKTGAGLIHDLNIITNGINSSDIMEMWASDVKIYNNRLEAHGKLPLHRHYPFSMIDLSRTSGGNDIYGNTLLNGPHVGINHGNNSTAKDNPNRSQIHHNTIQTRIVATNGFAISLGSNADVYSNTIQPVQGHGIGLGTGSNNVKIFDNLIEPRTWPCSEYSTYGYPNSSHGIRIKTYGSGKVRDVEISNNRIIGKTISQKSGCYTEIVGITNYITDSDPSTAPNPESISIHDNDVRVTTDNYLQQHAIAYKVGPYGSVYHNTFASNHIVVEMSDSDAGTGQNSKLVSNTLEKLAEPNGFHTLRFGYNRPYGNELLDTSLAGGADIKDSLHTRTYSIATDLQVAWFLDVKVSNLKNLPIKGATVSITDKNGTPAGMLITNEFGKATFELKEYTYYYDKAARFEYSSPYQIVVSAPGFSAVKQSINVTKSMEFPITLGSGTSRPGSPSNLRIP